MKKLILLSLFVGVPFNQAWSVGSGAFTNQTVGSKAMGMGNAFVAVADDPSSIFFNPAGLVQLQNPNLSLGLAPIKPKTKYDDGAGTTDTAESFTALSPNLYFSMPFAEKWAFGLGLYSAFGLETHWNNDSPLRYVATDSRIAFPNFSPVVAYKINDKVSVGGGVIYGLVDTTLSSRNNLSALNSFLDGVPTTSPDGGKKLEGDGDAWGYTLGVLVHPAERHSAGLTYRSEMKADIEGTAEFSGLSGTAAAVFGGETYTTDAESNLDFPQSLMVGYAFKPGNWTLAIDGEWTGYSTINDQTVSFPSESDPNRLSILNTDNPADRDWHNTWNLGLGANYKFDETWQARGGYYYLPQVIPTRTWDPSIPDAAQNGFCIGGSYSRPSFIVDLGYNLVLLADRKINNSVGASSAATINGEYETTAHILSANFTYRFGAHN